MKRFVQSLYIVLGSSLVAAGLGGCRSLPLANDRAHGIGDPAGAQSLELRMGLSVQSRGAVLRRPLTPCQSVAAGDEAWLTLQASRPAYLYVENYDDHKVACLFPPPGPPAQQQPNRPLLLPPIGSYNIASADKQRTVVVASLHPLTPEQCDRLNLACCGSRGQAALSRGQDPTPPTGGTSKNRPGDTGQLFGPSEAPELRSTNGADGVASVIFDLCGIPGGPPCDCKPPAQ